MDTVRTLATTVFVLLGLGGTFGGLLWLIIAVARSKPKLVPGVTLALGFAFVVLTGIIAPESDAEPGEESVVATAPESAAPTSQPTTPESTGPVSPAATATPSIPADVAYSVIDTDIVPGIKRSLDVRLNKKVSEDVLHAIALELKTSDSRQYDRTFIVYYLPEMTVGAGGWATTHFDPALIVRIIGLTLQEEEAFVTKPVPPDREIIGRWLDETLGTQITIYREGGTLYLEQTFRDYGSLNKEVVQTSSPLGQRFVKKEGSSAGDHWIIDGEGNLQVRDDEGLIVTAQRVQSIPPTTQASPEPTPTADFAAQTMARSNGVVCRSLRQLARDVESGAMATVGEMLRFIGDNIEIGASLSSPEIQEAVPRLRPPLEAGDIPGFTAAVDALDDACEKVGGYD